MDIRVQQLQRLAQSTKSRHYQLVLVVGTAGAGKTKLLVDLCCTYGYTYVNLGTNLSEKLLPLSQQDVPTKVLPTIEEILNNTGKKTTVLDNTEILFEPTLLQDPLRLLQLVSRWRTVVAAWSGQFVAGRLIYARPGHLEYRSYSQVQALVYPLADQ